MHATLEADNRISSLFFPKQLLTFPKFAILLDRGCPDFALKSALSGVGETGHKKSTQTD